VMATHEISACVGSIHPESVRMLLYRVADREMIDRLLVTEDDRAANRVAWVERWEGLCAWFIGSAGRRAQADELRAAARSAIPSLIATVTGINDRRAGHSDRSADFNTLAHWFAQTDTDADAHRLWRAAFALHSCRHLSVDDDTLAQRDLEPILSTTSWLEAPPIRISPRLHKSGRYTTRGKPAGVIDRSQEKARLEQLSEEEAKQIQLARRTLCSGQRTRLSELSELNEMEFQLLLDMLGDALSGKSHAEASVSILSSDGTIHIELTPTLDGETAIIRTSGGVLIGDDHYLLIRDEIEPSVSNQLMETA